MNQSKLLFDYSPVWLLLCVGIGVLYAYLLYQKNSPWSKSINYLLAGVRATIVAGIVFFLLNPMIRQTINQVEQPIVVIAVDNSESMVEVEGQQAVLEYLAALKQLGSQLNDQDRKVQYVTLDGKKVDEIDSIKFNSRATNISGLFSTIQNTYEGNNLAGVVLLSDGIFNQGSSPSYFNYPFPVYAIGIGDTIPQKDIKIKGLNYNKIAYQGNKFPLVVEVQNEGFPKQEVSLSVMKNGSVISNKMVTMPTNSELQNVEFLLDADQEGFQRYTVMVKNFDGEKSYTNNQQSAYLEVINGKQRILLAAAAPHPDVKAILSALEKNQNYEVVSYLPGIQPMPQGIFDLVIINEAFDRFNLTKPIVDKYQKEGTSFLFLLGERTNFNAFNSSFDILNFAPKGSQKDKTAPALNDKFTYFAINKESQSTMNTFPPLDVPYGDFTLKTSAQVLLYQKVGSITTSKPLVVLDKANDAKIGIIFGDGIWRWRLQEYAQNENTVVFDELISKLVQYLSTKEDKRKFKFAPQQNEYFDSEAIVFDAEVYNNIYEPTFGFEIAVSITNENGDRSNYTFVNSPGSSNLSIGQLPQGIYKYTASISREGKTESVSGELTVKELQLESLELTARHDVLRNLSTNTGGTFSNKSELASLTSELITKDMKSIIYSSEQFDSLIKNYWFFILIVALLTFEWFMRKVNGGY